MGVMLSHSSTSKTWLNTLIKSLKQREFSANSTENLLKFIFLKACYMVYLNMSTNLGLSIKHFEIIDLSKNFSPLFLRTCVHMHVCLWVHSWPSRVTW